MQFPIIKYYNPSIDKPTFCYYILCKGLHSGRPMDKPLPNCYIAICETQTQRDNFYWLNYAIFHARIFERDLIGSVIPFLRIGDFKKRLTSAFVNTSKRTHDFELTVKAMKAHHQQSVKIGELIKKQQALLQAQLRFYIQTP